MMNVFAAVRRMRNRAETLVVTVALPTIVTPVLPAIVIVPDAVFITEKSYPRLDIIQVTKFSKSVPKGIVSVNDVPVVTIS